MAVVRKPVATSGPGRYLMFPTPSPRELLPYLRGLTGTMPFRHKNYAGRKSLLRRNPMTPFSIKRDERLEPICPDKVIWAEFPKKKSHRKFLALGLLFVGGLLGFLYGYCSLC